MAIKTHSSGKVASNGIRIFYEAFGDPTHPVVLLIIGMDEQCAARLPYIYEPTFLRSRQCPRKRGPLGIVANVSAKAGTPQLNQSSCESEPPKE